MAFFSKAGSVLRQTVSKHLNSEISASNPSIFQMIRCMSSSKVFVGGISYNTDEASLRDAFSKYGEVIEARVIMDRETGRSRGFAFVTYTSSEEASSAIQALDGQELHSRTIRVNYANDRPRPGFGGGGGYGGGGYGGGGGGYGGGGSYGGGGGYGGAGNYGGGGYGGAGNYGGSGGYGGGADSYGSGGANTGGYAGGGNYDSGNSYGSGSGNYGGGNQGFGVSGGGSQGFGVSGDGNQGFGVAGGGASTDSYANGDAGAGSNFVSGGFGGPQYSSGDQFGSNESSNAADVAGGCSKDDPLEGKYRDDDEPDDYANRRV